MCLKKKKKKTFWCVFPNRQPYLEQKVQPRPTVRASQLLLHQQWLDQVSATCSKIVQSTTRWSFGSLFIFNFSLLHAVLLVYSRGLFHLTGPGGWYTASLFWGRWRLSGRASCHPQAAVWNGGFMLSLERVAAQTTHIGNHRPFGFFESKSKL